MITEVRGYVVDVELGVCEVILNILKNFTDRAVRTQYGRMFDTLPEKQTVQAVIQIEYKEGRKIRFFTAINDTRGKQLFAGVGIGGDKDRVVGGQPDFGQKGENIFATDVNPGILPGILCIRSVYGLDMRKEVEHSAFFQTVCFSMRGQCAATVQDIMQTERAVVVDRARLTYRGGFFVPDIFYTDDRQITFRMCIESVVHLVSRQRTPRSVHSVAFKY